MGTGTVYVIGEAGDDEGPVKIGMTFDAGGKVGRGGLNSGNWRDLELIGIVDVDTDIVRWREWLTHRRLRHRHVRGEWFRVRDLVQESWGSFLDGVWDGTQPGLYDVRLGDDGHEIMMVRQPDAPTHHFLVECSCGAVIDGGHKRTLPSALRDYALDHLGLDKQHPLVAELRTQVHHEGFTLGDGPV